MRLHCQDDSDIKRSRLATHNHLYANHSNRSAPNLLTEQAPLPQPPTHGLRSHLHFRPHHAYFHAHIQIHKVSNIPLVSGSFSVRWKFKNVHTPPGAKHGLLGMVKARPKPNGAIAQLESPKDGRPKAREDGLESDDSAYSPSAGPSIAVSDPMPFRSGSSSMVPKIRSATIDLPPRSSALPHSSRANVASFNFDPMLAGLSSTRSSPLNQPLPLNSDYMPAQSHHVLSAGRDIPTVRVRTPTISIAPTTKPDSSVQRELASAARGQTPTVELKDHSVVWNHTLNTVVRIEVSRDSGVLAPSPLKLIVVQQPVRNDPLSVPQNPRLGILYLNLAEYVGKGAVKRKYLLKESKTNAITELTIELEHVAGTTDYTAPPLPRGEIMNGIASLLEKDIYLTCLNENRRLKKEAIPVSRQVSQSSKFSSDVSLDSRKSDFDPPIDPRFPFGVEGTAALIDALFNPALTTEKEKESPFTLYVTPEELDNAHIQVRLDVDQRRHQHNLDAVSMYSTTSSSDDAWTAVKTVPSHPSSDFSSNKSTNIKKLHLPLRHGYHEPNDVESPLGSGRSVKGWWKRRITSRPATPTHA